MRRFVLILIAPLLAAWGVATLGGGGPVGGAPSPTTVGDNFDRGDSDSLGANWTEDLGNLEILGYSVEPTGAAGSNTTHFARYTGQALGTSDQWCVFQAGSVGDAFDNSGCQFRQGSSAQPHYTIAVRGSEGNVYWGKTDNAGNFVGIQNCAPGAWSTGDWIGAFVEGTGASTHVGVVTGASDPGDCDHTAGCGWTLDCEWTSDPGANEISSGVYVGVRIYNQSGTSDVEPDVTQWRAGDK